jgi:nitrate reductase cytochrome c-type subunit
MTYITHNYAQSNRMAAKISELRFECLQRFNDALPLPLNNV